MPGRNISILLNLIYFENLFRDIGFSSSYCFVPVYLSYQNLTLQVEGSSNFMYLQAEGCKIFFNINEMEIYAQTTGGTDQNPNVYLALASDSLKLTPALIRLKKNHV